MLVQGVALYFQIFEEFLPLISLKDLITEADIFLRFVVENGVSEMRLGSVSKLIDIITDEVPARVNEKKNRICALLQG